MCGGEAGEGELQQAGGVLDAVGCQSRLSRTGRRRIFTTSLARMSWRMPVVLGCGQELLADVHEGQVQAAP